MSLLASGLTDAGLFVPLLCRCPAKAHAQDCGHGHTWVFGHVGGNSRVTGEQRQRDAGICLCRDSLGAALGLQETQSIREGLDEQSSATVRNWKTDRSLFNILEKVISDLMCMVVTVEGKNPVARKTYMDFQNISVSVIWAGRSLVISKAMEMGNCVGLEKLPMVLSALLYGAN